MSQSYDLHRALLRPAVICILRAAGFHSTKPSVLDTVTNLAERFLLLLATTTAEHAANAHNDAIPTISDVRMALVDCGVLIPYVSADQEHWIEIMRPSISEMVKAVSDPHAAQAREQAAKRKREQVDLEDIRGLTQWFAGSEHHEIKRVAGLVPDPNTTGNMPLVGVGGSVIQAEDFLTTLKRKHYGSKGGGALDENARFAGTVLGSTYEDREVLIEGGPVQSIAEWRPRLQDRPRRNTPDVQTENVEDDSDSDLSSAKSDSIMT